MRLAPGLGFHREIQVSAAFESLALLECAKQADSVVDSKRFHNYFFGLEITIFPCLISPTDFYD